MRHLWSLLLALALTPLIYAGAGVSSVRLADTQQFGADAGIGLAAGLIAGGLYALLVMLRLSPVGPLVAGVAYLGVTVWALVDRDTFSAVIPPDLFGEQGALYRPLGMVTALLAAPLILTVFSRERWRGAATSTTGTYDAAPAYPPYTPSAAPSYTDTIVSAAPSYSPSSSMGPAGPSYEPPVYRPPTPFSGS